MNRLALNSTETQLISFGTPQQLLKSDYTLLSDKIPHSPFIQASGTWESPLTYLNLLAIHHNPNLLRLLSAKAPLSSPESCVYCHLYL